MSNRAAGLPLPSQGRGPGGGGGDPAPLLSVVVVNWNTRELLRACLDSLARETRTPYELWVIDNGSADGSAQLVAREFPAARLVANPDNRGFARATNQGLAQARGRYLLLLNPDTIVQDGAIDKLVAYLEACPQVGAVGPDLADPHGRLQVRDCGYLPTPRTVLSHFLFLSRLAPWVPGLRGFALPRGHDPRPQRVEWLGGACLLVRAAVVEQVGPLREDWFMYAEDVEWGGRIHGAGWQLVHLPTARVLHIHQGSSKAHNLAAYARWVRSLHAYVAARPGVPRPAVVGFDLLLAVGLGLRGGLYTLRAAGQSGAARARWWREARQFVAAAATALTLASR